MKINYPTHYELKRNSRFLVEFPEQFDIQPWSVVKINKPIFVNGEWSNIRVDFVDPIAMSTSQRLFEIVNFFKSKKGGDKRQFEIKIKTLDPTGEVVEEWVVMVNEILMINFGELDHENDDPLKPFMIIKPLNCILKY